MDSAETPSTVEVDADLFGDMVDVLGRVGCQFWACDGPDAPFEHMKTCIRCDVLRRLEERRRKT